MKKTMWRARVQAWWQRGWAVLIPVRKKQAMRAQLMATSITDAQAPFDVEPEFCVPSRFRQRA